jgi:hypothetical protein
MKKLLAVLSFVILSIFSSYFFTSCSTVPLQETIKYVARVATGSNEPDQL